MYEFAHQRNLINVEEPGGLLDDIADGGISYYQFSRWAEFYRIRAARMHREYELMGKGLHRDDAEIEDGTEPGRPKDARDLFDSFIGKYANIPRA